MESGSDDDLVLRAIAPPPVSDRRRRWRTRVVLAATVVLTVMIGISCALALADADAAGPVVVGAMAGVPALLGAVLASDMVLDDWLTPEKNREGRAYMLHVFETFGGCSKRAWIAWAVVDLLVWAAGGALVGGPVGVILGVAIGILWCGGCLLLGVLIGWLAIVPVGLITSLAVRRRRTVQSLRLALISLLLIGLLVTTVPAGWSDVGSDGAGTYLRAVLGLPVDEAIESTLLSISRIGVALLCLAVPALLAALRSMPEQHAAGHFLRSEMFEP
ncbi:hypothetical protein [Flexivirga sp. B27]